MDTADYDDTLVKRTYDRSYYEPPPLPEIEQDPNSDTRIPLRDRVVIGDVANIAFGDVILGAWVASYMAAAEAAYAAGYEAGVRSQQLMGGILTNADEMAFIGQLPTCAASTDDGLYTCSRAFGHLGDHAKLVDDDRAAEADPWYAVTEAHRWPRAGGLLRLDSNGPWHEDE